MGERLASGPGIEVARLADGYEMLRQEAIEPATSSGSGASGTSRWGSGRLVLVRQGMARWLEVYVAELQALDLRLARQRVQSDHPAPPLRSALTSVLTDLILSPVVVMAGG